jgi:hypothetical protein
MRFVGLSVVVIVTTFLCGVHVFANTGEQVIPQEVQAMIEDKEYLDAVTWMYEQQMTRFVDPIAFMPEQYVTRAQGAKFFVNYATKIAWKTIDTSRYCAFDDLDQADSSLKNDILQSCLLRLFKWTQGNFFPNEYMTKAQALTVLLRIDGKSLDESKNPRWTHVHEIALEKGYTKVVDLMALDKPMTRYEMALLLWRGK